MARKQLLERYRALPMPTTADESWRFTDLRGFDPEAFASNGHVPVSDTGTMLDIDVAGLARVSESGIEIERAPEGVTFAPLTAPLRPVTVPLMLPVFCASADAANIAKTLIINNIRPRDRLTRLTLPDSILMD